MLKNYFFSSLTLIFILSFPLTLMAETFDNYMSDADDFYNRLDMEGYRRSILLYEKALELKPDNYEANWKCGRSYGRYGEELRRKSVEDWKAITAKCGRNGMKYAKKAQEINPGKVEGYYWYARSLFPYSEGVSWATALKEGLYKKAKKAISKAYEIDKTYYDWSPTFMSAQFYSVIPWPLRNKKKAFKYYKEFKSNSPNIVEQGSRACFAAELLLKRKEKQYRQEAKALLEFAALSQEKYLSDWAKRLLKKNQLQL